MRPLQRSWGARLLMSLIMSAVVALLASSVLTPGVAVVVFVVLTVLSFALLSVAPDAIALQRGHYWRWWWRSSEDEGPFWPGTRIPRRPRRSNH